MALSPKPSIASPANVTCPQLQQISPRVAKVGHSQRLQTDIIGSLEGPIAALQAALAGRASQAGSTGSHPPRTGTKQEAVLTMLRRDEGATVAQIAEATAWQQHSVRGFLAGLKKKGITVETLERVRQAGPGKEGARGSYSVYRVAG